MGKDTTHSEGGEGTGRHRRISRACNFCRSKKIKCNGGEPKCSTCTTHSKICDYSQRGKKRGVPAGQYHLLSRHQALAEYLLGYLISNLHEGENSVKLALARLDSDKADNELECFKKKWRRCPVYLNFGKLLTELSVSPKLSLELEPLHSKSHQNAMRTSTSRNETPGPRPNHETSPSFPPSPIGTRCTPPLLYSQSGAGITQGTMNEEGLTSPLTGLDHELMEDENVFSSLDSNDPDKSPFSSELICKGGPDIEILLRPCYLLGARISLDYYRFPQDGAELLDVFFTNIHSFMPLLDKVDVLQFFHNEVNLVAGKEKQLIAREKMSIIWSSCALSSLCSNEARKDLVKHSYAYTIQLISSNRASSACTITRFQSLILFCLNLIRDGAWIKAREVVTLVCDMAIRHRLFDDRTLNECIEITPDATCKAGRRIWSSCFLLDTLIASRLGLLPTIPSHNCPIPLIREDNWEEWDSWTFKNQPERRKSPARIASTYNHLIRLIHVFNAYLSTVTFYCSDQNIGRNDINIKAAITAYRSLYMKMKIWVDDLPDHLRKDMMWTDDNRDAETSPHVPTPYIIGLNMTYHSFICFSCNNIMAYGGPSTNQRAQSTIIDTAARRLAVSSACNKKLLTLFSIEYGSTPTHPFLSLISQLATSSNLASNPLKKNESYDHELNLVGLSAPSSEEYPFERNARCKTSFHQSIYGQGTRSSENSCYNIDNHAAFGSTDERANNSNIPILENRQEESNLFEINEENIDPVKGLHSSQFEEGAEVVSSELLDHSSNDPAQFTSFMNNLGFVQSDFFARSSTAPDSMGPTAPLGADLTGLVPTNMDINSLQDILDNWMTGASDP